MQLITLSRHMSRLLAVRTFLAIVLFSLLFLGARSHRLFLHRLSGDMADNRIAGFDEREASFLDQDLSLDAVFVGERPEKDGDLEFFGDGFAGIFHLSVEVLEFESRHCLTYSRHLVFHDTLKYLMDFLLRPGSILSRDRRPHRPCGCLVGESEDVVRNCVGDVVIGSIVISHPFVEWLQRSIDTNCGTHTCAINNVPQ